MLRLVRYLKPYTLPILLAIALLFVQANSDLALPDYLSKIVNTGIQQGGVENAVPRAVRQSEMTKLVIFMSAENKTLVLDDYTLVDQDSPDYARYVQEYPILAQEPIYVLNAVDQAEVNRLNPVLGQAWVAVSFLEQAMADPAKAAALAQTFGFDLSQLPAGVDVFALLARLPAAQLAQMTAAMDKQFAVLGDSMINQMAVGAVKAEYAALGMDTGKLQTDYMIQVGILMLLLSLLSGACTITVSFLSARTAAGAARDMRKAVFQKVENFSNAEFDKFSTASLITRSTNDITQIQMVIVMVIRMVFYAPIIGVGGIIRAMGAGSSMWWIIAVAVVTLISLILIVFAIALPKFKIIQNLIDRLNLVTRENLAGMMVIRAFNRQSFELDRFDVANKDLTSTMLFINRIMVVMMPLMMFIMNGLSMLIIWVGAHQVAESNMQVGDMMAFLQYTMQIVFAFLMMSLMFIILPRASVSAGRVADVLDTEPTINDPPQPQPFRDPFVGTVEFRHVCFRYPDALEDVLHDISFTAQPGQTTAFIGSTGSGKSTIVNLIPRFYDVTDGAIYVDGTDIRQVTQHDLRDKIGYIPQKGMLFSGTIESNLRYADENATSEALQEATDIAQATEFIVANPDGLAAEIAQGGSNVSGGQKQRLAIARALVKKPPIYIFDDSFSAVDFKTDAALRQALKEKTSASTLLIVTQRVATIKNADQIVVLDEGRVMGIGTHRELMEACQTYREIALSQLSEEELA
ncbi:MAG: ABC transporter ATP-binding protein/permease [Chloroflexi bacterium]|nr:ABC transporter ATP-binding protein/permease [Chloroflexota bacterium]MBU1751514.1 ABC transporter ATP-binding protein/permease [Chloroflexota bacterium]